FQLVRIYPGPIVLAHVDLYRVADARDLADVGLDELLDQGAVVVEWGDRLPAADAIRVTLEVLDRDRRRLTIAEAPSSWSWCSIPPPHVRRWRSSGPRAPWHLSSSPAAARTTCLARYWAWPTCAG